LGARKSATKGEEMERKSSQGIRAYGLVYILTGVALFSMYVISSKKLAVNKAFLFFALMTILNGAGLIFLKEWARKMIIIILGLFNIYYLTTVTIPFIIEGAYKEWLTYWPIAIIMGTLYFLVWIFPIHYFTRPKVKEQFK